MTHLLCAVVLFCALPQESKIAAQGATLQRLGGGFVFTEGCTSDSTGNVYFTDQPNDRIMRWNVDGSVVQWMKPSGRSNGTWLDKKGNLIACADDNNQLWSISPDKKVSVLVKDFQGRLLNGPNDVWVRPDGGMYVTDPLYARPYWARKTESQQTGNHVYYLASGRHAFMKVVDDLRVPNGIIGTPDGSTLYVSDIEAGLTYRYRIEKSGALKDKKLFCKMGSDGMTLDMDGNLYLSGKGVTVFDRTGQRIDHFDVPEAWVGHVCFGGKDHRMLFITASKGIYGLQMKVRGAY